jgi:hypothetical protein
LTLRALQWLSDSIRFDEFVSFPFLLRPSFSLLILTVFDEEAHIGNSQRIDDEEQIGTGDRINNEEEIGPVSEWMTGRGSGTSPNRCRTKSQKKPYKGRVNDMKGY